MNLPDAVLFDFDGTLVHITIDFEAMRQGAVDVVHRYGMTPPANRYTLEMVEDVREAIAQDDRKRSLRFQEEALASIKAVEVDAAAHAEPLPGVIDTINWLKDHGVSVGIVTRNCRAAVETVAERHGLHYDALFTRDDVEHVKPHPGHLLAALTALGADPARSIMVGDHPTDIEAAINAGLASVGITTTRAAQDFDVHPDHMIDQMDQLLPIIKGGSWQPAAAKEV